MHVVIIDDHPLFREAVAQTLSDAPDIEVLGQGASAQDAIQLASDLAPDILLLDLDMPGGGLVAAESVARCCPAIKIVMLTVSEEEEHLLAALQAGIRGYVLKGISGRELIEILRAVWAGEAYVAPALATSLLLAMTGAQRARGPRARPAASQLGELSEGKREILDLVAGGLSNKEVGQQLGVTEKTIKHHRTNILQKLHVRNRVAAALLAERDHHPSRKT